jgi:hypothetical protein
MALARQVKGRRHGSKSLFVAWLKGEKCPNLDSFGRLPAETDSRHSQAN